MRPPRRIMARRPTRALPQTRTSRTARGQSAYLQASDKAALMWKDGDAERILVELEKALALYGEMPVAQQQRFRKLREAQEELAGETAFRLALSNLQDTIEAYHSGSTKRTAPVVLEIFRLFGLLRFHHPNGISLRSARAALESMDGLLTASPAGKRPTQRQVVLRHLLHLLIRYMPSDRDGNARYTLAYERDALREAWGRIAPARLTPLVREASMAMLGLSALDIICRVRDDCDDPTTAANLCAFGIEMLDGNDLVEPEAVGNLYLIGAYFLDCLGLKEDCIHYLEDGRRRINEGRAQCLRIDEIIDSIKRAPS